MFVVRCAEIPLHGPLLSYASISTGKNILNNGRVWNSRLLVLPVKATACVSACPTVVAAAARRDATAQTQYDIFSGAP